MESFSTDQTCCGGCSDIIRVGQVATTGHQLHTVGMYVFGMCSKRVSRAPHNFSLISVPEGYYVIMLTRDLVLDLTINKWDSPGSHTLWGGFKSAS